MTPANEMQVCETAAKLAQRYVEKGAYHGLEDEETAFEIAEWYMNRMGFPTFGWEHCNCDGTDRSMQYLNVGETYTLTVVYEDQEFTADSWGNWFEAAEAQHCEEENEVRCAYCGEWVEIETPDDWSETICPCGHYVDGRDVPNNHAVGYEQDTDEIEGIE